MMLFMPLLCMEIRINNYILQLALFNTHQNAEIKMYLCLFRRRPMSCDIQVLALFAPQFLFSYLIKKKFIYILRRNFFF